MGDLPTGVYERVLTEQLVAQLVGLSEQSTDIYEAEAPGDLADYLTSAIARTLPDLP